MGDNANIILKALLHFGSSRSKWKNFCSKLKESINCQMNGLGAKKILEKVITKEHIIKYVCKNSMNFQFLTNIKNLCIFLIHGNSNIKIYF